VNNTGEAIQTFQSAVSQVFNLQVLDTSALTVRPLINDRALGVFFRVFRGLAKFHGLGRI